MRRVRKKVSGKDKVFSCDLLEHLNTSGQDVPQVLRRCSQFIEEHGVVDGIYRLSGVSSNIQKLRGEFESDGTPDLSKEVYLQDIHCVSSLCKAYFRELPNPLLTYQLYDKFAEAVAVQLEEERLVKIRDVLQELPKPHYGTLEFLMRHLVKMASHSSETNMHARNLAIVWAPNLLRSKDIEVSGFNGTAAFMEVRVQSIVVEFILNHVPQLFPEPSTPDVRRKSLPSPTAIFGQEESLFKLQPSPNFGHISPGDGPLPMRPYHAIIEGTDKRKGSFKGRKWMSIFNIGSRFQDPRRRQKHSVKEKKIPTLRPARSMDSLSISPYTNKDPIRPLQTSRSTKMSVLEVSTSASPLSRSEYAVTYRRGTGLVSGGTQGTYTALDPEGLGAADGDSAQSKSPGMSAKAGRRVAMHITGPTMVTVPLHITSNLALGLLQGGGSDRVVHRGPDKDGGDRVETEEGGRRESKVDEVRQAVEENKVLSVEKEIILDQEANTLVCKNEEPDGQSLTLHVDADVCHQDPYEDMQGASDAKNEDSVLDSSDVLNSSQAPQDDQELSGYVQDSFEFLDHMDCSISWQIPLHFPTERGSQANEFSVEAPVWSDDEYELTERPWHRAASPDTSDGNESPRPRSVDTNERHGKSLSLPPMISPVCDPQECFIDGGDDTADDVTVDYSSSDDEDGLFARSLPADFFLSGPCDLETASIPASTVDNAAVDESSKEMQFNPEYCTANQQENPNINQDDIGVQEEEAIPRNEEGVEDQEDKSLRIEDIIMKEAEPEVVSLEMASNHCLDLAMQEHTDQSSVNINDDVAIENVRLEDDVPHNSLVQKETFKAEEFLQVSEAATASFQQDKVEEEVSQDIEVTNPEAITSFSKILSTEDNRELRKSKTEEDGCVKIWKELEETVCELIEEQERSTGELQYGEEAVCELIEERERSTEEVQYCEEASKIEKTTGMKTRGTEINSTQRFDQEGEIVKMWVPEAPFSEEVTTIPSLGDTPLQEGRSDVSESREGERFGSGPETCELEGTIEEKLEEDKPFHEEVTVTPPKDVTSEIQESEEATRLMGRGAESCQPEVTLKERLVFEEDRPTSEELTVTPSLIGTPQKVFKPIGSVEAVTFEEREPKATLQMTKNGKLHFEEVTATPSLRETPLQEVRADMSDIREAVSFGSGPERSEQEGPVRESFGKDENPICDEVIMMPSLNDRPLEEVRFDIEESGKAVRVEEREPDVLVQKTFVPDEEKQISEQVAVTPSLGDTPLKVVSSEFADPEGTVGEKLVTEDDKLTFEELTMTPSVGDKAPMELCSDVIQSGEVLSNEEREPKNCELQVTMKDQFFPLQDKHNGEGALVTQSLGNPPLKDVRSDILERGVERKLVISKLPKVYQVKAVPVVPPKPQHCKAAVRSLRQQREKRDGEAPEDHGATCGKDSPRNSPLSMCFDEAVAKATMRREKERESERERQWDWPGEIQRDTPEWN
ncbi:uncharacterized protein LOC144085834 [Stigmatopora argus]